MPRKEIGNRGEALAAAFLEESGYRILDRNYRFERAEIDLVCLDPGADGGEIVFVEVKARSGLGFGRPEDSVTQGKQRHIAHAARAYLYERRLEGARCRFDVVSVLLFDVQRPRIEHFKHAFVT
jgi:putative endonuclease